MIQLINKTIGFVSSLNLELAKYLLAQFAIIALAFLYDPFFNDFEEE